MGCGLLISGACFLERLRELMATPHAAVVVAFMIPKF